MRHIAGPNVAGNTLPPVTFDLASMRYLSNRSRVPRRRRQQPLVEQRGIGAAAKRSRTPRCRLTGLRATAGVATGRSCPAALAQFGEVVVLPARYIGDLENSWPCSARLRTAHLPVRIPSPSDSSGPNGKVASMPSAEPVRWLAAAIRRRSDRAAPPGSPSTMMTSRAGWERNAIAHSTSAESWTSMSGSTTITFLGRMLLHIAVRIALRASPANRGFIAITT